MNITQEFSEPIEVKGDWKVKIRKHGERDFTEYPVINMAQNEDDKTIILMIGEAVKSNL